MKKTEAQIAGEKRYLQTRAKTRAKTRAERRRKETQKKVDDKVKKNKLKVAIKMINDVVKLKVAPSEVHGVGVFALRDIKKGERVYANAVPCLVDVPYKDFNKLPDETSQMILEHFPQVVNGSHFMCPDTLMQMYLNHSNECNYDNQTDKALKAIKKGEEVFEDYRNIKGWEKIFDFIS